MRPNTSTPANVRPMGSRRRLGTSRPGVTVHSLRIAR